MIGRSERELGLDGCLSSHLIVDCDPFQIAKEISKLVAATAGNDK